MRTASAGDQPPLLRRAQTLHTRARSPAASRSPLQLGAELYGDASLAADIEVIDLMLAMLEAGIDRWQLTLDLGHGRSFATCSRPAAPTTARWKAEIFDALQRKSRPDLEALLARCPGGGGLLEALLDLHGDLSVLDDAAALFAPSGAGGCRCRAG
jgi:ATP phosphoribosyltransferase regulatory subunit